MKKIMITGASDGIGFEIAKILASEGNKITLVARNEKRLGEAAALLAGQGHDIIVADLSTKDGSHTVADRLTIQHYDVLINGAGVGMYGRFEDLSMEKMADMMRLNMFGVTKLSHAYLKSARRGDALVNIASTLGITSFPGLSAYAATKAFVSVFSESLWWEFRKRGVFVMGFCPGATRTKFHTTGGGSEEFFPSFVLQSPDDVAKDLVRALKRRRKPRVVSGAINRMMLFVQKLLSRKTAVNMMGGFSPIAKPDAANLKTIKVPQAL